MTNHVPPGDDQNLVTRAIAAHYRSAGMAGAKPREPSDSSRVETLTPRPGVHRRYVVLFNGTGVISVYRVHNNGVLRYMRRPPRELREAAP